MGTRVSAWTAYAHGVPRVFFPYTEADKQLSHRMCKTPLYVFVPGIPLSAWYCGNSAIPNGAGKRQSY